MHSEHFWVQVKRYKRQPSGYLAVDRVESRRVTVSIDLGAVALAYGERACTNKSRKAKYLKGLLTIKDNTPIAGGGQ